MKIEIVVDQQYGHFILSRGGHKTSHLGYLGHSLPVLGGEFGYKIPIYRREANCVDLKVGQLCTNLHNPGI